LILVPEIDGMDLDYADCVSLTHPQPISDEDVVRLVRAILDDDSMRFDAAVALVSHGARVSREVCELLGSADNHVVTSVLDALDSNPLPWDKAVIGQVEHYLRHDDEYVQSLAMFFLAKVTPDRDGYARSLCELASKDKRIRFVCMTALSYMFPIPTSCRAKLERLLVQYAGDSDFLRTVHNRLSEIR
jgi:hypothetical protein